jgi:hypothetical protein
MADDAGKREFIQRNVTSDLQYIWDDSEVSLDLQYRFGQRYKSLRVFIAIAENTADIRTALRTDFQVDPNAEVMGLPRNLQHSERLAMLRAVETAVEVLAEHDTPSSEYLALKVEECENGEILASSLDEVTSKAHKTTSSLQTSLDTAGHVRVVKNKTKGSQPSSTEEYRQSLKLEAITWLCMASKFKSKRWLSDLKMDHFQKFIDYILGDRVNSIKAPLDNQQVAIKPSWALVLQYEHRLRYEANKLVNRGECTLW